MTSNMEVHHDNSNLLQGCLIKRISGEGMESLKKDLYKSREINVELQVENCELRRCVQDLETRLQDVYKETKLQVGDLTDMLDDTEDKIKELETSYDTNFEQKIESESQLKHTERRLLGLCNSLDETEADNDELERKLGDAQHQIRKVESELDTAIQTKNHLTRQLEDTEDKVHILRQEISLLQTIGLERQKNLRWCEKEVRNKQHVASELIMNSSELRKKNDELNAAVNKLQNEIEDFQRAHIMLQEEFFQTQNILDAVQSGYKMMADEREALSEELHLFYEKHREVRSDYQVCVYEKQEREQEIALLKQHLEKIERDMYEMTKNRCSNSDSSSEAEADQDATRTQAKGHQGPAVEDGGIVLSHDVMHSAKDIDVQRPRLRDLSSQKDLEEEAIPVAAAAAVLDSSTTFREHDRKQQKPSGTAHRKQLAEMLDSFQRGWMEAIKLKSFREEQVNELLHKVARLELQIASLKDQNDQLQQRIADSCTDPVHNDVEPEAVTTDNKEVSLVRKLSQSSMTQAELIEIIQKLDSELEETRDDLLTARVFIDNFVEYKVKLCRKFWKEESKLYSQEKEICRYRAEQLRLKTDITLYRTRIDSMTARLNSAISERDRYMEELHAIIRKG